MLLSECDNIIATDVLLFIVWYQRAVPVIAWGYKVSANGSKSSTAIYATQHLTTMNLKIHVAAHYTGRQGLTAEAAASTEDVAIYIAGTPSADNGFIEVRIIKSESRSLFDGHSCIAQYVTVLTATEYGAENNTTGNRDTGVVHIRPLVEVKALVTLAGTKQIANHGMCGNLSQCARHT